MTTQTATAKFSVPNNDYLLYNFKNFLSSIQLKKV